MTGPRTAGTRLLLVLSAAIWFVAAAMCFSLDRYGRNSRSQGEVREVGASAVTATMVAMPRDAYRFWREKGFHGRTLVYVAAEWERIDPDEFSVNDPRRNYPLEVYKQADLIEQNFLDDRSSLYVAAQQGVCRGLIAVVSPSVFEHARDNAKRAKNAKITDDSVYVTYHGFPRWFTTLEKMATPDEPVLLYVAASAFRDHSPAEVLAALRRRGVATDATVLCSMTSDNSVTDGERQALVEFGRLLARGGA